MAFAITGATGHYGRLVIEALLARDVDPRAIVAGGRDPERLAGLEALGVRTAHVDYDDPDAVRAALDGVDALLLVSGSEPGARVRQHANVIDAAVEAGVGYLAYTSVLRADTNPLLLAPDHRETEAAVTESGIPHTFLRHGWYSENYTQTVADAIAAGVLRSATGDGRVASASRRDLAEAAAVVLTQRSADGRALELVGDTAWDYAELAAIASELGGREVAYEGLSADAYRELLLGFGLDQGLVGFLVALDEDIRAGRLDSDSSDLRELLGRPTEPLRVTLARELEATR